VGAEVTAKELQLAVFKTRRLGGPVFRRNVETMFGDGQRSHQHGRMTPFVNNSTAEKRKKLLLHQCSARRCPDTVHTEGTIDMRDVVEVV
jgi:hypothetical protein